LRYLNTGGIQVPVADEAVSAFCQALTELSARHGLAIGGKPTLFVMEPEDCRLAYICGDDGNLAFKEV